MSVGERDGEYIGKLEAKEEYCENVVKWVAECHICHDNLASTKCLFSITRHPFNTDIRGWRILHFDN